MEQLGESTFAIYHSWRSAVSLPAAAATMRIDAMIHVNGSGPPNGRCACRSRHYDQTFEGQLHGCDHIVVENALPVAISASSFDGRGGWPGQIRAHVPGTPGVRDRRDISPRDRARGRIVRLR